MIGTSLHHYRILRLLGVGGMGEVYAAEDTKLKRQVALKVLPFDSAGDATSRDRFQREAEAIAKLDHPNIVTIHSIESALRDEADPQEVHFFTMQLVEGQTLDRFIPEGVSNLAQLLSLALPLTDAVSAAHEKGITHRDLKPGNIMVGTDGRVRVLDFGLAKLHQPPSEGTPQRATAPATTIMGPGWLVGTPFYMSPEQVMGLPVDPRSDVFALGSILYEMVLGRRPFPGSTPGEVMSAILRDVPKPVWEERREFPRSLGEIVHRCLEKKPADRYLTARGLHEDLRRWRDATLSSSGSGPGRTVEAPDRTRSARGGSAFPLPGKPSLAVMPFVNLSEDRGQDYFATGLWIDLNADLVKISDLLLISPTTTGLYKNKTVNPQAVGRELGVRHILEGTVRKAGQRVRITAQLVETESGQAVWAERYDRGLDDLFELQDEINEQIVTALDVKLLHGEGQRILRRSLKSAKARDIYYQAMSALFTFKHEELVEARRLLAEVSEIEPDSPLAPVFTAFSHYFEAHLGVSNSTAESLEKALVHAQRAIELGDPTGTAYMIKGMVHLRRKEHESALEASEKAVRDRPSCPWVYALKGAVYNYTGKPSEAIALARSAIRHTPLVPPIFAGVLATGHYLSGQLDEAIDAAKSTIQLGPDHLEAHVILAAALAAAGQTENATPTLQDIFRIKPDFALDDYEEQQPFEDPSVLSGLLNDLRTAGLT